MIGRIWKYLIGIGMAILMTLAIINGLDEVILGIAMVIAGLIVGVFSSRQQRKAQEIETGLMENALEFYCDITKQNII